MVAPNRRLILSGYYGFGNSGDEAVLQSILNALDEQGRLAGVRIEPVVLSANPPETERQYGVRAVHRMRPLEVWDAIASSDGLISGGGSLLQDATSSRSMIYYLAVLKMAQWLGKPAFIYAQGIGPVHRRLFHRMIAGIFNRLPYISVRDSESASLLVSMGIAAERVQVVPDPVMGLAKVEAPPAVASEEAEEAGEYAENPWVIGVSVRYWRKDKADLRRIAEALDYVLAQSGGRATISFLPFHSPTDEKASEETIHLMKLANRRNVTIVRGADTPLKMLAEVQRCDVLIGMRLHSLIYAASQYVPMVGISYDPKIDQFLHQLGMKCGGTTEALNPSSFAAESLLLLQAKAAWMEEKRETIDELKKKAQLPAQQICQFLRNRG